MKIEIEISEEDYKSIESTVMTIEEMYETLDGRLYRAVVNGYRKCVKEETNHDDAERSCFTCANAFVDDDDNLVCVLQNGEQVNDDNSCDDWN